MGKDLMADENIIVQNESIFKMMLPLLEEGQSIQLMIKGYSMTPFLYNKRDTVVFKKLEIDRIRNLDVLLYRRSDGTYVMHRLIKQRAGGYYFMGDGEWTLEGPIQKEQLLAVASGFIRKGHFFPTKSKLWRMMSFLWLLAKPVRKPMLVLYFKMGYSRHKNKKQN